MCGIAGIVGTSGVNHRIYDALTVLQHRGQDAAGIATVQDGELFTRKGRGLVRDVFEQHHMQELKGNMGMGHVRYPTAGCDSASEAQPFAQKNGGTASSDIGEVSAVVPLAELNIATRPLGTAAHHWAQTACAAHPLGYKGMAIAAKVLAASTIDVLTDPTAVKTAKEEFVVQTKGKPYVSPLAPGAKPVAPAAH